MRFVIMWFTAMGVWLLFSGITNPIFLSEPYFLGLFGSLFLGGAVGLIFGEYEDNRKKDRSAVSEKNADQQQD